MRLTNSSQFVQIYDAILMQSRVIMSPAEERRARHEAHSRDYNSPGPGILPVRLRPGWYAGRLAPAGERHDGPFAARRRVPLIRSRFSLPQIPNPKPGAAGKPRSAMSAEEPAGKPAGFLYARERGNIKVFLALSARVCYNTVCALYPCTAYSRQLFLR